MSAGFLERYEIVGELGSGSFGRVWKARQISTGRLIALKVLASRHGSDGPEVERHRQRFQREMQVIATLSHPHIVRLIDSGDDEGTLYAAFEFLQGSTLREILDTEGRLDFGEALRLMSQVLDALACAHEQGVVHRDLKPENIIITKTGARRNAIVLDFGLAGFTREVAGLDSTRLTATQEILGTPAYSAPEQLRGGLASARSDLYSWGLTTLECLTGELAVSGATAYEAITRQLSAKPVSIPVWLRDHRLGRLLAAVTVKDPARRNVDAGALLTSLDAIQRELSPVPAKSTTTPGVTEGERRQVTVVVCGIPVTRTGGGPIDLEDLDRLERSQFQLAGRLAREEGGTLAHPQPGRFVIVFGYPRAHENDARRAVRVACRIVDEVRAQAGEDLQVDVRVGVDSGLGVVRLEPPGSDGEVWCQITGAPLRIASRLENRAQPGEILVTDDTRVLLREEIPCSPAGEIDAPEHSDGTLRLFRVTRAGSHASEHIVARRESPLAGRATELARLDELWQGACAGEPATVLVQGEAGIGKSRLLRELARTVPPDTRLECRCLPEDTASPLRPIVELLAGLDEPIEDLLSRYGFDLPSTQPLLASLLGLPHGHYNPLRLSPERQKELTLKAVVSLLVRVANTKPRILTVEDLHWIDPTSLELLRLLVDECRAARAAGVASPLPLLVVFTARPEFKSPWGADDAVAMSLGRLRFREIQQMVNADRSSDAVLPEKVVRQIAERTDGVPLFVEELAHALGAPGREDTHAADSLPIPGTLRELLASRLDGLSSSAYETAQIASAYGRESPYDLLRAVSEANQKPEWILQQDIQELLDAGLLYQRSVADSYVFKHALVRDAAYDSMMRSVRENVHGRIADALLNDLSRLASDRPEVLALHLFESGDLFGASGYWHQAGERSQRRAAYEEAIQHLEHGLRAIARMPATEKRDLREFDLLITLATVHFSTKGYAAPEVDETFGKARRLYDKLGQKVSPLKLFTGLFSMYVTRGDRKATEEILPRFADLTQDNDDAVACLTGLVALAVVTFWQGAHDQAHVHLRKGRALYHTEAFQEFAQDYGYDGGIFIYGYSVWNSCIAGRHGEAAATYQALSEIAESSFDPYSLPLALAFGMAAAHARRDVTGALSCAQRLIEMSNEQRMYLWLAIGQCGAGLALTMLGQATEGIASLRQGLDLCRLSGAMTPYSYYLSYLAGALLEAGLLDECSSAVEEGLQMCETSIARAHEPEFVRIAGEVRRRSGDDAEAEVRLKRALTMAEERGAGTWAMRSALSLARLFQDRRNLREAKAVLDSVTRRFPEAVTDPDRADMNTILGG